MARKKKTKPTIQKQKVSYEGCVQIQLMHGNKAYKTINQKNAGRLPLFDFIARCLAGYFNLNNCPKYIRAFHAVKDETTGNYDIATLFDNQVTTSAVPVSSVNLSSNTSNEKSQVNFEFILPFTVLKLGQTINVIALYNTENRTNVSNPSAYIILQPDNEIEADGESNIKIVWSMIISNK